MGVGRGGVSLSDALQWAEEAAAERAAGGLSLRAIDGGNRHSNASRVEAPDFSSLTIATLRSGLRADRDAAAEEAKGPRISWGELGSPREIGIYRENGLGGRQIRVKKIHIIVAESDPSALFTVVEFRPPLGPAEYMLGHRVA